MTTTPATTHAPKPAEAPARTAQQGQGRAHGEKPAGNDLFASLLNLASDTLPGTPTSEGHELDTTDTEVSDPNPLAALLAWANPALNAAEGHQDGGTDAHGAARVDGGAPDTPDAAAKARSAKASRPAFSPWNPNAATASASHPIAPSATTLLQRAADTGNATGGAAPAMVWQRGAASGTEALHQQQSAQFAQVRASVALNERLGVGAEPLAGAPGAGAREFTAPGAAGATNSPTAGTPDAGLSGASGTGDGSGGDAAGHSSADQGSGDGQPQANASAEAEGPTVSHWGTQHLRHASLRVGEAGADAIDIQLAVKGQEVQVAFQTDNAEARATLRESAGDALAELMQRSGIQLGSVSVGSQGQAQGDGSQQPARPAGLSTEALGRASQAAEPAARPAMPPRADGSRPLDVFA